MSEYDGTENPGTPWRDDGTSEHDNRGDEGMTGGDRTPFEPNPAARGTGLSALVALLGVVLVAQAALGGLAAGHFWNDVFVGATLFVAGAYNYSRRSNAAFGSIGVAGLIALVGLWLVAAPFVLGTGAGDGAGVALWTDVVGGLIAFGLGSYSAYEIRGRRREVDARRTAT